MIDTHAHLYAKEFDEDRDAVLQRAIDAGITQILLPNIDEFSFDALNKLAQESEICKPMMGLHPCSVTENYVAQLKIIRRQLDKNTYIAIGEIGIDLYWDKTTQTYQEKAFIEQCKWAEELKLPIAIHARDSTDILISLLNSNTFKDLTGVFHCFGGTSAQAREIIDMGFMLGIGGVLTFKNSGLKEALKHIGLEQLVLETDAPYLAPVPYRGKRNESSYMLEVVQHLSYVYDVPQSEIIELTTQNALKLFKL